MLHTRYLKNHASDEAHYGELPADASVPVFPNKSAFREWCNSSDTDHYFYSMNEGSAPGARITGSDPETGNPIRRTFGFVADFDSPVDWAAVDDQLRAMAYPPTWRSRTYSNYCRAVWVFEEPIQILPAILAMYIQPGLAVQGGAGAFVAGFADNSGPSVSFTNVDLSVFTSNDLAIFVYLAEGGSTNPTVSGAGATFSLTVNSTTASVAVSNSNTAGNARVGIFYVEGSVVAGDTTVNASLTMNQSNGFRSALVAYRLINGSGASVLSTDVDEQQNSNTTDLSTTVNFSSGRLISAGYYSVADGHTFGTNQLESTITALANANGSGDMGHNNTPGGSSYVVDYNFGGGFLSGNEQGDAMATAVFG